MGVVVGDPALHLALEVAPGDVDGPGQGALLVFVGLPHVEHHRARLAEVSAAAVAVSTSRIRALVSRSRSRKVAISKCYLVGRHFVPSQLEQGQLDRA